MTIRSMKIHQLDSKINNNQLVQFSYHKITEGESTLKMLNTKKKNKKNNANTYCNFEKSENRF